ncbi:MAG: glutamine synthetase [Clostridiales bacterium]|nr:glutamine synthetase [Clostridiales bacterium]
MKYSKQEVMQFVCEEDVKFIRLAFCDIFGRQKNISIQPGELERAFDTGIAFDASSIAGFGDELHSDLFLHPEPSTLVVLPWRPEHGRVVRMFCDITWPDGTPFDGDSRQLLKNAIADAEKAGCSFRFGAELEFYLFELDERGKPTKIPCDEAGYMDIAPDDRGENIRREICLTLEQMGITPESSHHEGGPGQNEIDFRYSDPLTAADNAVTFCAVVKTIASRNGIAADFSPKPLEDRPGNGMHVNFSVKGSDDRSIMPSAIAGVLENAADMTVFLNTTEKSYERLGQDKAPRYISWSAENRSQLIRIPAAFGDSKRAELRSPDPCANPYIVYTLMIYAGLDGISKQLELPPAVDINLFTTEPEILSSLRRLPASLEQAQAAARESSFIRTHLPERIVSAYTK